jgi:hypothetical protein
VRELPEAEAANAELAKKCAGTAAELAAIVLPALELRLPLVFDTLCCGGHRALFPRLPFSRKQAPHQAKTLFSKSLRLKLLCSRPERDAESLEQFARLVVVRRGGDNCDVHAFQLFHLRIIDLREDKLVAHAKRVVAAPIKALG